MKAEQNQKSLRFDQQETTWANMLADVVRTPGKILEAYTAFWEFSVSNQILALFQCHLRGICPGPLNTYRRWQELGRQVKKGERALTLCMPLLYKKRSAKEAPASESEEASENNAGASTSETVYRRFALRPYWFVFEQTQGDRAFQPTVPGFDCNAALQTLGIQQVEFTQMNGNVQGYALERTLAINPLAQLPQKTLFHELGHIVLGHTGESIVDSETTPRNLREVEAESVALLCCESLGLPGAQYCRGYVQSWLGKETISDRSAQKIFAAASTILKAGRVNPG